MLVGKGNFFQRIEPRERLVEMEQVDLDGTDALSGECQRNMLGALRFSATRSRAWLTRMRRIMTAARPMNCARLHQSI